MLTALCVTLAGCATVPPDRGFSVVQSELDQHGVTDVATPADTAPMLSEWLAAPLSLDTARRIAFTQHPRLRAGYAALGIAQAEVYEAARLSNPVLDFEWLASSVENEQITLGLAQNFASLLKRPARKRQADAALVAEQLRVAADLLDLSADIEVAYYRQVGARASLELCRALVEAADVASALAARMHEAGNISLPALRREQAAATTARIAMERARAQVEGTRATLNELLGLDAQAGATWKISAQLPLPVAAEDSLKSLRELARDRLDLTAARAAVTRLEERLGISRRERLLGEASLGVTHERDSDGEKLTGPTLSLELPVFDWGRGRELRAQAELEKAQADLHTHELEVERRLRAAYAEVKVARAVIERYRHDLLPQRDAIVQSLLAQQHFMLVGQFEVLAAKQDQYDAYQGYLEALTDYAVARAELTRAAGNQLPSGRDGTPDVVKPAELLTPSTSPNE